MSQWHREHPEEAEEIAKLPLAQQNEALRNAMRSPTDAYDMEDKWERWERRRREREADDGAV